MDLLARSVTALVDMQNYGALSMNAIGSKGLKTMSFLSSRCRFGIRKANKGVSSKCTHIHMYVSARSTLINVYWP